MADKLIDGISKLPGLQVPYVQDECSHVYYVFPIQVDSKVTKIHRDKIFSALTAEGLSIGKSYGNSIYYQCSKIKLHMGHPISVVI